MGEIERRGVAGCGKSHLQIQDLHLFLGLGEH